MRSKQLYSFDSTVTTKNGAPRLVPLGQSATATGGAGQIRKSVSQYSIIDVIHDFEWTTTPEQGRQEIPEIFLKEKRLIANTYVAQAAYYAVALAGVGADAQQILTELANSGVSGQIINALVGAGLGAAIARPVGTLASEALPLAATLFPPLRPFATAVELGKAAAGADVVQEIVTAAGAGIGGIAGGQNVVNLLTDVVRGTASFVNQIPGINTTAESLGSKTLLPYEGLYLTEDTNFIYRLPLFADRFRDVANQFTAAPGEPAGSSGSLKGAFEVFSNQLRESAYQFSSNINFNAPGVYLEKPQFYNFNSTGKTTVVRFPLINTGWSNYIDVLRNWQLLYMLVYQNIPNRRSRDLIDPPVIYEISSPGVRYHPYAYIESMRVDFLGSTRQMRIQVPYSTGGVAGGGTIDIESTIPEAYDVTITLRELTTETQNFMYAMLYDKAKPQTYVPKSLEEQFQDVDFKPTDPNTSAGGGA